MPEAQFQYALMLLDGASSRRTTKRAYALMQAAADAGNPLAQFNFAQMLVEREPARAGLAQGRVLLSSAPPKPALPTRNMRWRRSIANGVGGEAATTREARRWLALAARQNFDTAQLDLGTWLVEARRRRATMKAGFGWMKRAARGGNVAAQNRLAKLYMDGIGIEPDSIEAARLVFRWRGAPG